MEAPDFSGPTAREVWERKLGRMRQAAKLRRRMTRLPMIVGALIGAILGSVAESVLEANGYRPWRNWIGYVPIYLGIILGSMAAGWIRDWRHSNRTHERSKG